MLKLSSIVGALIALLISGPPLLAQQPSVALTFDDLPAAGTTNVSEIRSLNLSILNALDRHHVPAIGFVIGSRVEAMGKSEGPSLLKEWFSRGYELGNHTFSHTSLNNVNIEQFEQDIVAGETSLTSVHGTRYFRFPENTTGDTQEKHAAIASFLKARGYKLAVCTIDNSDFLFNNAYLKMLSSGDNASAARLRADYLTYTSTEIDYYSELNKKVFGRQIPDVMLLHVNRLNSDVIEDLLKLFEKKAYHFVSLDVALSDTAYSTPDTQVFKSGWMWGYRWAKELGIGVNMRLEPDPPQWILRYGNDKN